MPKKCTICGLNAKFNIKNTSDYYCEDCAVENFGDISMLIKVEDQAKKLKNLVEAAAEKNGSADDEDDDKKHDFEVNESLDESDEDSSEEDNHCGNDSGSDDDSEEEPEDGPEKESK